MYALQGGDTPAEVRPRYSQGSGGQRRAGQPSTVGEQFSGFRVLTPPWPTWCHFKEEQGRLGMSARPRVPLALTVPPWGRWVYGLVGELVLFPGEGRNELLCRHKVSWRAGL